MMAAVWPRHSSRLLLLALLGAAAGCNRGEGIVSGRVLLDGVPLPGGTVAVFSVSNPNERAFVQLDESGAFSFKIPAGEVMIGVDNRALESKPPPPPIARPIPRGVSAEMREKLGLNKPRESPPSPAGPTQPGRYVAIPAKYYAPESSGLGFTVPSGSSVHDIPLSSK
jgi:hypothetical protein